MNWERFCIHWLENSTLLRCQIFQTWCLENCVLNTIPMKIPQSCFSVIDNCAILIKNVSFPSGSDSKESACKAGDLGLIPGLGRSPGGGHGNSLQYSCLEYPHGQRSLVSCSPRDHKESDTTERPSTAQYGM